MIVSKCELPEAAEVSNALAREIGQPVLAVSAATGQGLDTLVRTVALELERRSGVA